MALSLVERTPAFGFRKHIRIDGLLVGDFDWLSAVSAVERQADLFRLADHYCEAEATKMGGQCMPFGRRRSGAQTQSDYKPGMPSAFNC